MPVSWLLSEQPNAGVRDGWLDASHQYPLPEGRYFGNLFANPPQACVCAPDWSGRNCPVARAPASMCAFRAVDPDGRRRSVCGMVHVGPCGDAPLMQDGQRYDQSVPAFLPAD